MRRLIEQASGEREIAAIDRGPAMASGPSSALNLMSGCGSADDRVKAQVMSAVTTLAASTLPPMRGTRRRNMLGALIIRSPPVVFPAMASSISSRAAPI